MSEKIRIGTRGSKLALWQAYHIADLLKKGGMESEIITIDTKGDKQLDVSIAKIGSKGVFTEEIEEQLRKGTIDIAVHSAKDMQSELPEGFELIAFTEREEVNDVIVSHDKSIDLNDTSRKILLGTSSTRRVAILKHFHPHITTTDIRGNLQTRIARMEEGKCDALLLAFAGVHRMGYHDLIVSKLPLNVFIPAVGQGSVAVEASMELAKEKRENIRKCTNHSPTEYRLLAERAFLKKLQGGCSIPVFALANLEGDTVSIKGGIISLDGKELVQKEQIGPKDDAHILGTKLAEEVLKDRGRGILDEIKSQLGRKNID
jgi:hydroxymethylbilane synthase